MRIFRVRVWSCHIINASARGECLAEKKRNQYAHETLRTCTLYPWGQRCSQRGIFCGNKSQMCKHRDIWVVMRCFLCFFKKNAKSVLSSCKEMVWVDLQAVSPKWRSRKDRDMQINEQNTNMQASEWKKKKKRGLVKCGPRGKKNGDKGGSN